MARDYRDIIVAIGMATSEVGLPIEKFKNAFSLAQSYGFKTTSHFWDDCLIEQIKRGLSNCGLNRVDHGMCAFKDEEFMEHCLRQQIPFTFCPLSCLKFGRLKSFEELNLFSYLNKGLVISVNSDDPAYNQGYIGANYHLVAT
jgi:adenosine deaminase